MIGGKKYMKNKLIGIVICVMMLVTLLPVTALATTIVSEPQTTPEVLGRTNVMGFVLYKGTSDMGKTINLFAIKLRYSTISITGERSFGVIIMEPVEIPSSIHGYYGHMFIFVTFRGSFEP